VQWGFKGRFTWKLNWALKADYRLEIWSIIVSFYLKDIHLFYYENFALDMFTTSLATYYLTAWSSRIRNQQTYLSLTAWRSRIRNQHILAITKRQLRFSRFYNAFIVWPSCKPLIVEGLQQIFSPQKPRKPQKWDRKIDELGILLACLLAAGLGKLLSKSDNEIDGEWEWGEIWVWTVGIYRRSLLLLFDFCLLSVFVCLLFVVFFFFLFCSKAIKQIFSFLLIAEYFVLLISFLYTFEGYSACETH